MGLSLVWGALADPTLSGAKARALDLNRSPRAGGDQVPRAPALQAVAMLISPPLVHTGAPGCVVMDTHLAPGCSHDRVLIVAATEECFHPDPCPLLAVSVGDNRCRHQSMDHRRTELAVGTTVEDSPRS
jgi:hypothetical protein